jgi:hypothetical protein
MAAKAGFPLAGFEVLVSEDWVVGAPGLEPGTHRLRDTVARLIFKENFSN